MDNRIHQSINQSINQLACAVEIGCGLGEIISYLKCNEKYGYDICPKVITAAKELHKTKKTNFIVGSFNDIGSMNIDFLIVVNFTAFIAPATLKDLFNDVCNNNRVKRIVVECVDSENYKYCHDFSKILPDEYKLEAKSKAFIPPHRTILIFHNSRLNF